jgi:class 3 adenylate cyclase/tetratricopeptide (TPR) repeat protein
MAEGTRRERKVVTVVFCDLVGFTSRAETMDPEDVEALLTPYHDRVRSELERRGGTVEKFIGDAVMALFGAPTAHEDDPERAVRAALAIRDFAVEESLELRVGITTGEALVRLDARPDAGEGMASGDVVNTAARLQSAAPVNGIVVDETTYRATRQAIDYRDADAVEAKGKASPIPVWEAVAAHSRFGVDLAHEARTELVGRERELGIVRDVFERTRYDRTPQLLTLVGVPGIGKSRLVYELRRIAEDDEEIITWRQGHCLAYGDGVTMWALGEIVKAQAGILEGNSPEDVVAKIRRALEDALPGSSDAAWIEPQLLALVGQGVDSELGGDRRGQSFAAWRRFLEGLAEQRQLVLVVEDLHWADESMLDFVDELVEWVTDVPLLVVGTARPELLTRRPNWAGGKLNATTVALSPLTDEQTSTLIGGLLARPVLADAQQALLEHAGGNPLYAEQFAELYLERGSAEDLPLPETLQGVIAARLDGLETEEKELLQDAAVVGKVFWSGSLGRGPESAAPILHSLERKAFVRRERRTSIENESEYAFAHALVRDVAYGQIPRAERAAKHRAVAEWIESLGRFEDHAEMRAYHWRSALDLARASGADDSAVSEQTRFALRDAGDRAFGLNSYTVAASLYEEALGLWPEDEQRPILAFSRARALFTAGDERAADALSAARDTLVAAGRSEDAAEAEAFLAQLYWFRGQNDEVFPHLRSAEELVAGAPPSPGVARVLAWSARYQLLAGERELGLQRAEEALVMAETLDLVDIRLHALTTIGSAKEYLSDATGREDLERAIEIGRASNSPMAAGAMNNLTVFIDTTDMRRVDELFREGLLEAERFGDAALMRFLRGNSVVVKWILGEWDDAMSIADDFIAECESGLPTILEGPTRLIRGCIALARGHAEAALPDLRRGLELARGSAVNDQEALVPALVRNAWAQLRTGHDADARATFGEAFPVLQRNPNARPWMLAEVAFELDETDVVRDVLRRLPPSPGLAAMLAVLDGDFATAAKGYAEASLLLFEAEARLRLGGQLATAGRRVEASTEIEKALAFYRPNGATLFIEQCESILVEEATG